MLEWATKVFEDLLFSIRRYGPISAKMKSSSSTRKSNSSRDSNVRFRILARDGSVSPVGRAIDESAPEDIRDSYPDRATKLEAAHIMPFMLSKYSTMQTLLSMFAGTNMEAILGRNGINGPSNIFCTDHDTRLKFDQFFIGIEYLNGQYWLRKVNPRKARGPFISHCQDGEEVIFGLGPQGPVQHSFSIGNVLHASGAGEVINKVLQDEEDYDDGIVEDVASAARISAFALRMALKRVQAVDPNESSPGDDGCSNKLQEARKGVLRVRSNSQIDS
ncbi:hypothetical protein POJ06DRAFT_242660 [Lipomyces tetrasporus]|uniref:HNH nuclease domain-containing protein n=1 Tax=Lipomyces tetrasporus TaxID=54092 RepID=A0AAD7VVP6_9ASCO|nr:uncharacterized protein POJ06DRAFT_242660 [Lipomyces tetrasporus]KAJ8103718.1 hypothetical protein POJ06DRAFT_242660 [Lipomyces tetrasporus]